MKKYVFCYCLALVCHLYGMNQNSNYAALHQPMYLVSQKLSNEYPEVYNFALSKYPLNEKLISQNTIETQIDIILGVLNEFIKEQNKESPFVSIVQNGNTGNSTQSISNCRFVGKNHSTASSNSTFNLINPQNLNAPMLFPLEDCYV